MRKESNAADGTSGGEDMKALFKVLQNDGRIYVNDIDKLSRKIDKLTEESAESNLMTDQRSQRWRDSNFSKRGRKQATNDRKLSKQEDQLGL